MSQKIKLLEDEDVRRWYENLARGSKLTADVRLRRVGHFCNQRSMSPKDLVILGKDVRKLEDFLHDCVSEMEMQNYAPGYIDNTIKAVRSWLSYNYIELRRRIKIAHATILVTIQNEEIPSKKELKEMLNAATRRGRASISLMAFAGLRPQVLGNDDISDALCISDIPDLTIENETIQFKRIPACQDPPNPAKLVEVSPCFVELASGTHLSCSSLPFPDTFLSRSSSDSNLSNKINV